MIAYFNVIKKVIRGSLARRTVQHVSDELDIKKIKEIPKFSYIGTFLTDGEKCATKTRRYFGIAKS